MVFHSINLHSIFTIALGERYDTFKEQHARFRVHPTRQGWVKSFKQHRGMKESRSHCSDLAYLPRNTVEYKFMEDKVWRRWWEAERTRQWFQCAPRRFTFRRTLFSHRNSGWQLQQQQREAMPILLLELYLYKPRPLNFQDKVRAQNNSKMQRISAYSSQAYITDFFSY